MNDVTTDIGPFAMVPEWLLYSGVSTNAICVFATLHRFSDKVSSEAYPGREKMAELTHLSVSTVDRAVKELQVIGAVTVTPRYEGGRQTANLYHLHFVRGRVITGDDHVVVTDEDGGVITRDEQNDSHIERESEERETSSKRRLVKEITAEFVESMIRLHPLVNVRAEIARAKDHPAYKPNGNPQMYIRNWLNRESRTAEWKQRNLRDRRTPGQPTASIGSTLDERKAAYGVRSGEGQ